VTNINLTTALTRLLSDTQLRSAYGIDRYRVAREMSIAQCDFEAFVALDMRDLEQQAQCLIDKRYYEVARLLPQTVKRLGSDAQHLFVKHASFWPVGHRRHLIDAIEYCRYVNSRHPEKIVQAELTWLRFQVSNRWLAIYRIVDVDSHGKKNKSVHLFVRMRNGEVRRLKFRFWPLFCRGHVVDTR
jgi:hypothetical protein